MDTAYLKKAALYGLSIILSLALIAYLCYHLWHSMTGKITTAAASPVTITEKLNCDGYIMCEEEVLYAQSADGYALATVPDGTRIGRYDEVARIYREAKPEIQTRLIEVENQISLYSAFLSEDSLSTKDASKLDSQLYGTMCEIKTCAEEGGYSEAVALRSSFLTTVGQRSVVTGGEVDFHAKVEALETEKTGLIAQLGAVGETVYASHSGYYQSHIDGYEKAFSSENIDSMYYSDFASMVASAPDTASSAATAQQVAAGKIVTDYSWYVVVFIDGAEYKSLGDATEFQVTFPYNQSTLTLELYRSVESDGKYAVILRSGKISNGFALTRMQPVEIVNNEYTGFRVDLSSVRVLDGFQGVYILDKTTVHFRRISVMTENESSFIVETAPAGDPGKYPWLALNEQIITEGKNMYEGRTIT